MADLKEKRFEKIYREYVKLVYFIISKYVDDRSDREDLTSDVFVDFYVKMDGVKNVKYYLVTAAKNKAVNHVAKNKRVKITYEEEPTKEGDSYSDGGYYDTVNDMKKVLSDREIEIIIKHLIFDKTFRQLSDELGQPLKTIYSVYKSAIKKYRKYKGVN